MEKIKYLYNKLLLNKNFHSGHLRTFLILYSENKKKDIQFNISFKNEIKEPNAIIKTEYIKNIIKNKYTKIIIINNSEIYKINTQSLIINKIKNKLTFNKIFDYYVLNNLNINYITTQLFTKKYFKITVKSLQKKPIHIINITTNTNNCTNNKYIDIENNTTCTLYDLNFIKLDTNNYFINRFIHIKNNTNIKYNLFVKSHNKNDNILNIFTKLDKNSNLSISDLISNNNISCYYNFFLVGIQSKVKQIIFKFFKEESTDYRESNIFHYNNNTKSNTNIGIISYQKSNFIFNGNIHVATLSKNTDAHLKCAGLILTNNAKIEFNPNMFINNNDVKCTHGASIGNMNENILNYLKSRGVNNNNAISILTNSFINTFKKQNKFLQYIAQYE
ncbi:MAG: SufD family Fe-S cluster assembly protein [Candidatus Riesia sp.]|nr:SufD family Fe-S cluster assembly protein [Candidatus Riesia sp.]